MSNSQEKTIASLYRLKSRAIEWHALQAAADAGIFQELTQGQRTAAQIAEALSLDKEVTARLMQVLCRTEMVDQYGDDFALTTLGKLMPASLFDFGNNHLQHLTEHLKTGAPIDDSQGWNAELASREWTLTPAALTALQALGVGSARKGLFVLDVHAGSAVFSSALAHRDPGSRIFLVDEASQLERARKTVASVEIGDRTEFITMDPGMSWWEAGAPGADLMLMVNEIHKLSAEQRTEWFAKARPLLHQEGELMIVDVFRGLEDGEQNADDYELELGLRAGKSLCDAKILESELKETGFRQVQFAWLTCEPFLYGLLLATK